MRAIHCAVVGTSPDMTIVEVFVMLRKFCNVGRVLDSIDLIFIVIPVRNAAICERFCVRSMSWPR